MKFKLTASFLFVCISLYSQQIIFFNIGIQDKPLTTLVIGLDTKNTISTKYTECVIVRKDAYLMLLEYIANHDSKTKIDYSLLGKYEFGSYGVTILNKSNQINTTLLTSTGGKYIFDVTKKRNKHSYSLSNNQISVLYFKNMIRYLKSKKEYKVAEKLNKSILRRIEFINK